MTNFQSFITPVKGRVVILMGSKADNAYATTIQDACTKLGVPAIKRVSSAHKTTDVALDVIAQYKCMLSFVQSKMSSSLEIIIYTEKIYIEWRKCTANL